VGAGRIHILVVLLGSEYLLQQIAKLDLAPGAACLDIGQDAFEITYARRQALHLAEPFVDLDEFTFECLSCSSKGLPDYKPVFVSRRNAADGNHSSWPEISPRLQRPTRNC